MCSGEEGNMKISSDSEAKSYKYITTHLLEKEGPKRDDHILREFEWLLLFQAIYEQSVKLVLA